MRNWANRVTRCFSLIELAIAMGVVAVGIASIMVLFPVGLNATRDSMAETYAAESADQFLHFVQYAVRDGNSANGDWVTWISDASSPDVPSSKPVYNATTNPLGCSMGKSGAGLDGNGSLFQEGSSGSGVYQIVRYVDDPGNGTENELDPAYDTIDFRAIMLVWQSIISIGGTPIPNTVGVALNAEISWPGELPYPARKKASYRLELFKR